MRKLSNILTILLVCTAFTMSAQPPVGHKEGKRKPDKTEWLKKMKQLKHEFLTRELNLTDEQQRDFFPVYDSKEDERFNAERAVRRSDRNVVKKENGASEAELQKAIDMQYELDSKFADIEMRYKAKFEKILTKRQLFKLRHAERDFQRMLVERQQCNPRDKNK